LSLFYYYGVLREKREHLQRLQECQSKLQGNKQEFASYRESITNPELSAFTWQGTLANKFDEIRLEGILHYFTDIENNQFSEVLSMLSSKMQTIRSEIQAIEHTIHRLESEAEAKAE
jgi:archaellum component FlaC